MILTVKHVIARVTPTAPATAHVIPHAPIPARIPVPIHAMNPAPVRALHVPLLHVMTRVETTRRQSSPRAQRNCCTRPFFFFLCNSRQKVITYFNRLKSKYYAVRVILF
jgi:hypothetical protein